MPTNDAAEDDHHTIRVNENKKKTQTIFRYSLSFFFFPFFSNALEVGMRFARNQFHLEYSAISIPTPFYFHGKTLLGSQVEETVQRINKFIHINQFLPHNIFISPRIYLAKPRAQQRQQQQAKYPTIFRTHFHRSKHCVFVSSVL